MRYYITLFLTFWLYFQAQAQSNFLNRTQIGLSYDIIRVWRTPTNVVTINNQGSINPVESLSLEFIHDVFETIFFKLEYGLDREEHSDLGKVFYNSSYFLSIGYRLILNDLNEFRPRLGWGVINRPNYGTAITEIQGRPDTRSVIHYYYGKEPFTNWSVGMDYRHNVSDSIIIGLGFDVTYNFNFRDGRTYLSPFIGYKL